MATEWCGDGGADMGVMSGCGSTEWCGDGGADMGVMSGCGH